MNFALTIRCHSDVECQRYPQEDGAKVFSQTTSYNCLFIKATLSGVRQFVATESPLKMMKNAFCFTVKAFRFQDI